MAKVAALTITCLLGLLGSVACNGGYYSSSGPGGGSSSSSSSPSCFLPGWMTNVLGLPLCYDNKTPPPPSSGLIVNPPYSSEKLTPDYYDKAGSARYCPKAKSIVRETVQQAMYENNDLRIGAGLVRLFFHDCFVRGCDASVLLNNSDSSNPQETEMLGLPNIKSLRPLSTKVIHDAKAKIEEVCSHKVSCADIVAFAASDASDILSGGKIKINMPAGRLDGRVSNKSEAEQNLPGPFSGLEDLESKFEAHGLSFKDMVALSGAHSFGEARCRFSKNRLPPNPSDKSMDAGFAHDLNATCGKDGADDFRVNQDYKTPNELDHQYYINVKDRKVLFTSDAALYTRDDGIKLVNDYAMNSGKTWYRAFEKAMVNMGELRDKTINRPEQEIRDKCWIYNSKY